MPEMCERTTAVASDSEPRVRIDPVLPMDLHGAGRAHYGRLLTFLLLYVASAVAAARLAEALPWGTWTYAVLAPLVLLAAGSLHGVSLLVHEGVHDTLSPNR